ARVLRASRAGDEERGSKGQRGQSAPGGGRERDAAPGGEAWEGTREHCGLLNRMRGHGTTSVDGEVPPIRTSLAEVLSREIGFIPASRRGPEVGRDPRPLRPPP